MSRRADRDEAEMFPWVIRQPDEHDPIRYLGTYSRSPRTVGWTPRLADALGFSTREGAREVAAEVGGIDIARPTGGKPVDNPSSRAKSKGKPVDNSPCAWCGRPLHWTPSRKGGRPRVRHEECVAVDAAFTLLERAVDAQIAAGLTPIASEAKVLRRDVIGLAWRMAPGKLGAE